MADSTAKPGRENSVKMLLTSPPVVSTAPSVNSGLPSPTGETLDENPNKLITYLHQLAGSYEVEVNVIMKDHCYARPWNWKPENIYVKPVKKLFFSKTQNTTFKDGTNQEELNVEKSDPEPQAPPYDLSKVRQSMDEFQRVANFVRPEETDDWEEKIDKILWSPVQNRIFSRIIRILNSERIARLAKANSKHEPILRRTSIDNTAKRFRETMASANWDWRITQWLHSLLFDYLPQDYLAIYLDVLQTLRQKVPQLIDKMIAVQPNINSKGSSVSWETLGPLLKKSWDPVSPALNANRPKKLPGNPILILTPNGMSSNISSRQHKWITQLGTLGMVVTVNPHLGLTANRMTMIAGIEQLVQTSRAKIQDIRVDYPGRPIILVGFNTGAALACQIAQMEHVTAIVCLGFPVNTVDGKRGSPDDSLLDVRSPVMFVIGQNSMLARIDDVEELRERMLVPTSLVVVGSADDHLRVSTSKKIIERISQSMVDRCILDEIGDFVGGILLQPHPLPLRSANALGNYDSRQRKAGGAAAGGAAAADGRKRKNSTSSSVESSETQSPNTKRLKQQHAHSAQQVNSVNSGQRMPVSGSVLPRGTLVALTGTTGTQTPRRKSKLATFASQNYSEQLITSRLTPQQQSLDNSTGGITLNIGSFASLAPVGPIRFEPTSISLQNSPAGKVSGGNALKTPNAFIKVSKNSQMNITGHPNVPKIKMIMPTKKAPPRNTYKNVHHIEKSMNVLTPTSTGIRVSAPTATVTNIKANTMNANTTTLSSIRTTKSPVVVSATLTGKPAVTSSSVLFTPKNSSPATTSTTATIMAMAQPPTKVADGMSTSGGSRKPSAFHSGYPQQDQLTNSTNPSSLTGLSTSVTTKTRSPRSSRPVPKISLKSLQKSSSPQFNAQTTDKSIKICSGSTDTTLQYTPKSHQNVSLDDDLGNIFDIPIIIAKDGENLNNLERLSPLALQAPDASKTTSLPVINAMGNKVVFINNKSTASSSSSEFQQSLQSQGLSHVISTSAQNNTVAFSRTGLNVIAQPTIKYTKIILTKKSEHEEKNGPVILTKTNRRANNFVFLDPKSDVKYTQGTTRIPANYLGELQNSTKNENLNVADSQCNSNIMRARQS